MKKWIIGAVAVAAAVVAVAVLTKPGDANRGGKRGGVLKDDNPASPLVAQNEKAKELSRKIAQGRAERAKLTRPEAVAPAKPREPDEAQKALSEAMKSPFSQTGYVPKDPAKHAKANDVIKLEEKLDERAAPASRPKRSPDWGAVSALDWKRLTQLYTGFSLGKKMGGDFREDLVAELNGAAVEIEGAVMPIDPLGADGVMKRFWIARPDVVMAGCVFCKPPSFGDLVYVTTKGTPLQVDREKLYSGVVIAKVVGRFELGPTAAKDGTEYLFGLEMKKME